MKEIQLSLKGTSPYSQSRPHTTPKLNKETPDAHEARTWMNRLHVKDGQVFIPGNAIRNCLAEAAKFLSIQIPGKGKATYTKHFESGIIVPNDLLLFSSTTGETIVPPSLEEIERAKSISPTSVVSEVSTYQPKTNEAYADWIFTPADGVPGSGKRVWKCYPIVMNWQSIFKVIILDDTITEDVFHRVLEQAGVLIGLGRYRVRNRGSYGQFIVESMNVIQDVS